MTEPCPPVFVPIDEMSDNAIGLLRILAKCGFKHNVVVKGGVKGISYMEDEMQKACIKNMKEQMEQEKSR